MATAEAKQRKEEESRHHEPGQAEGPGSARRSQRSGTRQLDFFQAMSDFRAMFPTLDDEVIEAVLRANDGAVDATIDQLLTMTIDEDITSKVSEEELMACCPQYNEQDQGAAAAEDSPPSYSEAIRAQAQARAQVEPLPHSIWTTPIGQPFVPMSRNLLDSSTDLLSSTNTETPKGQLAQLSPSRLSASAGSGSGLTQSRSGGLENGSSPYSRSLSSDNTRRKAEFKNWNPPMLGNLPDDFLRLIPPDTMSGSFCAKSDSDKTANLTTTPVSVLSVTDVKPKTKSRSKSEKILSRSFNTSPKEKDSKGKGSEKKSKSLEKMSRSFSVADGSSSHKPKVSRSHSGRSKDKNQSSSLSPSHRSSVTIETHDFSQDMLAERMRENERRLRKASSRSGGDPTLTQYLEDEKLALALQNGEFLQELRGNEDFMATLQRDRAKLKKKTPQETPAEPEPVMTRPPDDVHEGYGDDTDKTLDAFPFSQELPKGKEGDAELRRQLSGMGKASRKQLATLAKKFFRRKKKSSKQILGEKLAPSMMNLLEDDDDEEEEDLFADRDRRYGSSPPEIEPLSLANVPSHRTVQRPAYQPDGVTTYFDNKNIDIV